MTTPAEIVPGADVSVSLHKGAVDEVQQNVFGWASVSITKDGHQVTDHQLDMIDPEDLEAAAYEFNLEFRETGEMHRGLAKGRLIESMVFTPEKLEALGLEKNAVDTAWWVGFHIDDEATFAKVLDGTFQMFSIQGTGVREPVVEKAADATDAGGPQWEARDAELAGGAIALLTQAIAAVTTNRDRERAEPPSDMDAQSVQDLDSVLEQLGQCLDVLTNFKSGEAREASDMEKRLDGIAARIAKLKPHAFEAKGGNDKKCAVCDGDTGGGFHK